MSERKRGGLDYTPRAFPGARDPDGPAPDLEDRLAQLGLVEREGAKDVRADASAGANPGAKKRSALEYTPQAFPGARDPDGPAPGLEDRLVQMGLAERIEPKAAEPGARHDASYTPPPARAERAVAPPVPPVASPARVHREPAPPRPAPSAVSPHRPRRERTAPAPESSVQTPLFIERPEPVHVPVVAAAPPVVAIETPLPPMPAATQPRSVPPEPVPRPLAVIITGAPAGASHDISPAAKPASRAAQAKDRLKQLPEKETRIRRSVRLAAAVDAKLQDLAHLRGLDLNTAVGVAIVQDWVACFGPTNRSA